ncbi:MAG: nucleotide exchange factor GrpE [Clostridiales Family XIII bacterium]|jgi:molecular chaperone GrpE|nr:nucleotide exchange factor GrpE [Clostridiales Family XIII bacterium]
MSDQRDETERAAEDAAKRKTVDGKGASPKGRAADETAKRRKSASAGSGDDGKDAQEAEGSETAEAEKPSASEPEAEEGSDLRYMRLAADFQNYKKRTEKEKSDIYVYANAKFAGDLLEVLDNFERAVAQDAAEGADAKFLEGMDMIRAQLINVLKKNDVEEIAAAGEVFDPNVHHAVVMEASDAYESGRVSDVLQKGYKLKDRVIRPAMVKVAE